MKVPLVDLAAQQAEVDDEVWSGLRDVFSATSFIDDGHVSAFEQAYAEFVGVGHCVGVGNGTDALEIALRVAGVGRGDDVLLPANTFIATAEAAARAGARPVLVDVDPDSLLMDAELALAAVTPATRAVVPVHLFGQMAPVESLLAGRGDGEWVVVEDAAQAQGARRHGVGAGGQGLISATSFYPGKNLGAAGDAGAVTTNSPELARAAKIMGAHGSERKYVHNSFGFNSRMDSVQAVVLHAKLRRLADWNRRRHEAAGHYAHLLEGVEKVKTPSVEVGNEHVWHLYVVQVDDRDRVIDELHRSGVGAGIHYPTPVHLTGAFRGLGHGPGDFPVTEAAAARMISLPIFPHIGRNQQEYVVETLVRAVEAS